MHCRKRQDRNEKPLKMMKKYLNDIDIYHHSEGNERRYELLNEILDNGTFIPKTVNYKDIDEDFKRWVEEELKISDDDGREYPTMTLYSNQRFSEYAQTWEYTDENNNILLNFKTINRDNNPELGSIVGKIYTIPGERFYLMKRKVVLDNNGSESLLDLKMKIPLSIDLSYKLTVFTTKFQSLNDFNRLINAKFRSRQCYLKPNGHFMPMVLDSIGDESVYSIDDRQFYAQSYKIKTMAYIITEDDYKVEERPLKFGINIKGSYSGKKKADVEIEECDTESPYYFKPITLTIHFPECTNTAEFTIDTDFNSESIDLTNILNNYSIFVNDEKIDLREKFVAKNGDVIKITIKRRQIKDAVMIINGYNPNIVYDKDKDIPESTLDIEQFGEELSVEA